MIQRKCSVGYNKAGKIVEWMEDMGYISSFDGAKARKVLITKEEFERLRDEANGNAKVVEINWKRIDEYGR
jgi:S-DNA-T family DNA segregation ATPase FtsK/SpoIIIE